MRRYTCLELIDEGFWNTFGNVAKTTGRIAGTIGKGLANEFLPAAGKLAGNVKDATKALQTAYSGPIKALQKELLRQGYTADPNSKVNEPVPPVIHQIQIPGAGKGYQTTVYSADYISGGKRDGEPYPGSQVRQTIYFDKDLKQIRATRQHKGYNKNSKKQKNKSKKQPLNAPAATPGSGIPGSPGLPPMPVSTATGAPAVTT